MVVGVAVVMVLSDISREKVEVGWNPFGKVVIKGRPKKRG